VKPTRLDIGKDACTGSVTLKESRRKSIRGALGKILDFWLYFYFILGIDNVTLSFVKNNVIIV
jgi:hypothetical protein